MFLVIFCLLVCFVDQVPLIGETIWYLSFTTNFPNLMKEIDIRVQEMQTIPNRMSPKRPTPRHITIKKSKVKYKERILKATREKQLVSYKEGPIRLSANFSKETLQAVRH